MNKREIASLACKILGIYLIIQGINVMANILSTSIATPNLITHETILNIIFSYIFLIIFGALLWFLSGKLSLLMVKDESPFDEGFSLKANDIQGIVFAAIGLVLIGNSLPKFATNLINLYITRGEPNMALKLLPGTIGAVTQILIGIGIFLGSHGLVKLLNILRNDELRRGEESLDEDEFNSK
ncbi:hypothetical protein [Desulfitobacterium sp. AusDCA]|uniref:hypothetical protein n=1 Tax=Desulfitobacterium sp. AusDCA TaxID=3240383 RepID=UPI003DA7120B